MKLLIVYPHGIGDCILATPALRNYKRQTGNYIGFIMLERFKSSKVFDRCPYIDEIHWCKDAWDTSLYPNYHVGIRHVIQTCQQMAVDYGYDKIVFLDHKVPRSKILLNFENLGCDMNDIDSYKTDVFISDEDIQFAKDFIGNRKFGFVHSYSPSLPPKNFPKGYGKEYIKKNFGIDDIIEVGVDFKYDDFDINKQFAIMNLAEHVCVIDSAFYHACGAMDKDIDLAFFKREPLVYERVKPLHDVKQNIKFELDAI